MKMGLVLEIIFLVVAVILLAVAGGFITHTAATLTGLAGYDANKDLQTAHKYSSWAAVVTWITIALIIVGGVLMIFFFPEEAEAEAVSGLSFGKILVYLFIFLAVVGIFVVGILSAIAASDISKSGVQDNKLTYRNSIIATVLAILGGVTLIIIAFVAIFRKPKVKEDTETKVLEKEVAEQKIKNMEPPAPRRKPLAETYAERRNTEVPRESIAARIAESKERDRNTNIYRLPDEFRGEDIPDFRNYGLRDYINAGRGLLRNYMNTGSFVPQQGPPPPEWFQEELVRDPELASNL